MHPDPAGLAILPQRRLDPVVARAFPGLPQAQIAGPALSEVRRGFPPPDAVTERLTAGIGTFWRKARPLGADGLLVGLSGGVDGVVCAELCRQAAAGAFVVTTATVLVGDAAARARLEETRAYARAYDLPHICIDGGPPLDALRAALPQDGPWTAVNLETRAIQSLLFQIADAQRLLVCATTDASEYLLGRFTEGFYGQIAPLAGLYKSDVIALARHLGLDPFVVDQRPGCEGHWYDDEVLGAAYSEIDPILHMLAVDRLDPHDIAARHGIADVAWIERLRMRMAVQPIRTTTLRLGVDDVAL